MYKLYEDNIITKGYYRDLLLDFSRDQIIIIPKELTHFIEILINKNEIFSIEETKLITDLLEKEIIFKLDKNEAKLFPKLSLDWDFPATISNAVIEVNKDNVYRIQSVVNELEALNCFYYAIIITEPLLDEDIEILQKILLNSSIICFELIINYFKSNKLNFFLNELIKTPRIKNKIKIFNCNDSVFIKDFKKYIVIKNTNFSSKCCGCIKEENFNINLYLFTESQKYNSCLNRKLSIDTEGNIKNCPSMKKSFGNIKDTTLKNALNKKGFKKYWNIKKDDIAVCKDCEFRHICTDCRAYTEDPNDIYSKPLKCGYNPYTGVWEEWSANPLKQKTIEHYGMEKILQNKTKNTSSKINE